LLCNSAQAQRVLRKELKFLQILLILEGRLMIEKCLEIVTQYDVSVNKAVRGRGAVILDTSKGLKKVYELNKK